MKAILVTDMPSMCWECPYFYNYTCLLTRTELGVASSQIGVPINLCPLKPLPQKIEVDVKKIEDIMHTEFQMANVFQDKIIADIKLETDKLIALGWNKCIDKISGEE